MAVDELRIKNKQKRQKLFAELKDQHNKERHSMRRTRAKEERENPELKEKRLAENVPDTIDNLRVYDETMGQEVEGEMDDFMKFFNGTEPPKILLTTNVNAKKKAYEFANILILSLIHI